MIYLTRSILKDLAAGRSIPDLLIQPQLQLSTSTIQEPFHHTIFIAPDFLILDPATKSFVPGEEKSFIIRNGICEPTDLDHCRRQAATEIIALRSELTSVGIPERVLNRAVFIFASPHGLHPAPLIEERNLDAEVFELTRALRLLQTINKKLITLKAGSAIPLVSVANKFSTNYQVSCLGMCILAHHCKASAGETARILGSPASELLGPDTDLNRISALLADAIPVSTRETKLIEHLREAAQALGFIDTNGEPF